MKHVEVVGWQSRRVYGERAFVGHRLHQAHFEALNRAPVRRARHGVLYEVAPAAINALNGYCLDAPDLIPRGCMGNPCGSPAQSFVVRGVDLQEQKRLDRLVNDLIDQLLAEQVVP